MEPDLEIGKAPARRHVRTVPPRAARRAFVTYLMFSDNYLPGCLLVAYGLQRQNSNSKRVCIVTEEVSPRARGALSCLYDKVVQVEKIPIPGAPRESAVVPHRTGSARVSGAALTRFATLRLGPDGDLGCSFDKVALLDADLLPIRDFDTLWTLPTPAGIINERREHMAEIASDGGLVVRPQSLSTGEWVWHDVYGAICPHGEPIPRNITDRVAVDHDNYGVNASLLVVEPSMTEYRRFMRWAATNNVNQLLRNHWPWSDQQAATLYWSGRWTSIDPSFSTLYGYPSISVARGLHFAGTKPWSWRQKGFARRLRRFPDYTVWANMFVEMLDHLPELRTLNSLRRLEREMHLALPLKGQSTQSTRAIGDRRTDEASGQRRMDEARPRSSEP